MRRLVLALLLLFLPAHAWGAWAFVQKNKDISDLNTTQCFPGLAGVTAGNFLAVWVFFNNNGTIDTVTDGTNTYSQAWTVIKNSTRASLWYAPNVGSGNFT